MNDYTTDEEKYNKARIKFLKEMFEDDFESLISRQAIADDLDSLFHGDLVAVREDIVNPDGMMP